MDNKVTAVLLDTISIQKYIFSGRKLKEFVGASYIVDWIYDELILTTMRLLLNHGTSFSLTEWETKPDIIQILKGAKIEIGYVGGGNALIFFSNSEDAKKFVKQWTLLLLHKAPGLIPSVAIIDDFYLDGYNYTGSIKRLFEKLEETKNSYAVNVFIPRHGISAECLLSGYAKEVYYYDSAEPEKSDFISSILKTKLNFTRRGNEKFQKELINTHDSNSGTTEETYIFPTEIDGLGQIPGEENYIAIVHIDGNSTGQLFQGCQTLIATRELSKYLKNNTKATMSSLITELIKELKKSDSPINNVIKLSSDNSKKCLPIRPVILGGDDVTFICNGKLGIWLAEKFIEIYEKKTQNNTYNLSLSAGILITKSHMPFYRAYQLSENLCSEAKKKRKRLNDQDSWLDFHIAYGSFSGSLKEIRERYYKTHISPNIISLCMRPYKVNNSVAGNENCFSELKKAASELAKQLPHSKLIELRKIIATGDEASAKDFIYNCNIRGRSLPQFPGGNYNEKIWDNGKTPYFDMIELIEFYPFL